MNGSSFSGPIRVIFNSVVIRFTSILLLSFLYSSAAIAHNDFVDIISKVKLSVVTIDVSLKGSLFGMDRNRERDSALGKYADFYKDEFKGISTKSKGSGFVIKRADNNRAVVGDEWILTSAHVVSRASKIKVTFDDGTKKIAEILWTNTAKDVALLAVSYPDFSGGLELSERKIADGEPVLAIGGAFGFGLSSTVGIISAQNVKLRRGSKVGLLQTDAAINPGSSGGPLFNIHGEVIGLVSNIYSKTGTFSGAAFAVPANTLGNLLLNRR